MLLPIFHWSWTQLLTHHQYSYRPYPLLSPCYWYKQPQSLQLAYHLCHQEHLKMNVSVIRGVMSNRQATPYPGANPLVCLIAGTNPTSPPTHTWLLNPNHNYIVATYPTETIQQSPSKIPQPDRDIDTLKSKLIIGEFVILTQNYSHIESQRALVADRIVKLVSKYPNELTTHWTLFKLIWISMGLLETHPLTNTNPCDYSHNHNYHHIYNH